MRLCLIALPVLGLADTQAQGPLWEQLLVWLGIAALFVIILAAAVWALRRRRRGERASAFDNEPADDVIMGPLGPGGSSGQRFHP